MLLLGGVPWLLVWFVGWPLPEHMPSLGELGTALTSPLDDRKILNLLANLHQEGATICMVTHDPRFARHADRIVNLFDGRVVEDTAVKIKSQKSDGSREIQHNQCFY